jgi:hypothetical protein
MVVLTLVILLRTAINIMSSRATMFSRPMDILEEVLDFLGVEVQLRLRQVCRAAHQRATRAGCEQCVNFILHDLKIRDEHVELNRSPWHTRCADSCHGYCLHFSRVLSRKDHTGAYAPFYIASWAHRRHAFMGALGMRKRVAALADAASTQPQA